jgi:hypothetical protein
MEAFQESCGVGLEARRVVANQKARCESLKTRENMEIKRLLYEEWPNGRLETNWVAWRVLV